MARGRFLAMFLVGSAFGACQPIEENAPSGAGFRSSWPRSGTAVQVGTDAGGTRDLDTVCDGNPPAFESVTCDVHFATDIAPILLGTPVKGCAAGSSCHVAGGDSTFGGPLGPAGSTSANEVWNLLTTLAFRSHDGRPLPYVNICSTDPAASAITCNLDFNASSSCGTPMPKDEPMDDADRALIASWLQCGAPNN